MGTQGTMKPDSRKLPVALDRARRDVENCGDLFHGKSAEVAQLNHPCLSLVFASKTEECLINGEDFVDAIGIDVRRDDEAVTHLYALAVWDYCSASASLLFGDSTGDPIADRIREALEDPQRDYRGIRSGVSFMVTSTATASTLHSND
jgi:hypothetical protein